MRLQRRSLVIEPVSSSTDSEDDFVGFKKYYNKFQDDFVHLNYRKYGLEDADQLKLLRGVLDRNAIFGSKKRRSYSQDVYSSFSERNEQEMRRKSSKIESNFLNESEFMRESDFMGESSFMRESNFSRIETSKNLLNNHTNLFKAPKSNEKVLDGTHTNSTNSLKAPTSGEKVLDGTLAGSDLEKTLKNTRTPDTNTGGGRYLGREVRSRRSNRSISRKSNSPPPTSKVIEKSSNFVIE